MLQNRYGETEFPVRVRWSYARLVRRSLLQTRPRWANVRGLIAVAPALVLLLVLAVVTDGFNRLPVGTGGDLLLLLGLAGFPLLVAVGLVTSTLVDARRPRVEQERYRELTGDATVTERQQQLLALDAQSDFGFGGWNSSLDYGPAWSRMPLEDQRRHAAEPRWRPFATMPLLETDQLRAQLDDQWHIASRADLELFLADALSTRSLSALYGQVLAGDDGERMLARVSSLTGVDQWDLRALVHPGPDGPPPALWAADTQRTVAVIRMAHLAGHVDAATAWELIDHAAGPGTSLFHDWDAYWNGVRIGLAFHTDRLEAVQRFDHALAGLRASAWPAARVDFPRTAIPSWLPRTLPTPRDRTAE